MRLPLAICASLAATVLPALAAAPPPVKLDCKQFSKVGPNEWEEKGTASFAIGNAKQTLTKTPINPKSQISNGVDLFAVLEEKCGK